MSIWETMTFIGYSVTIYCFGFTMGIYHKKQK